MTMVYWIYVRINVLWQTYDEWNLSISKTTAKVFITSSLFTFCSSVYYVSHNMPHCHKQSTDWPPNVKVQSVYVFNFQ